MLNSFHSLRALFDSASRIRERSGIGLLRIAFTITAIGIADMAGLLSMGAAQAAPPPAAGPSASRVAPQSIAPLKPGADGAITLPETISAQAPAGADQLTVTLAGVTVEGGSPPFSPEVARAIAAATTGLPHHQIKVSDLYDAAARIEAAFAREGHVLTRVTLRFAGSRPLGPLHAGPLGIERWKVGRRLIIDAILRHDAELARFEANRNNRAVILEWLEERKG